MCRKIVFLFISIIILIVIISSLVFSPYTFNDLKEGSVSLYQNVLHTGTDKTFDSCQDTADGNWYCDGKVYNCDSVVSKGEKKDCKNAEDLGDLTADNVCKDGNCFKNKPFLKNVSYKDIKVKGSWGHVDVEGNVYNLYVKKFNDSNSAVASFYPNVLEDDIVKDPKNAKSLIGYYKPFYLLMGKIWGDMEYGEFNYTDVEVYPVINDFNELNKDHVFYVDGVPFDVINYNSLDDRKLVSLHFNDWAGSHNWTFNPTMTLVAEDANSSWKDNYIWAHESTGGSADGSAYYEQNMGASTVIRCDSGGTPPDMRPGLIIAYIDMTTLFGSGNTYTNITFQPWVNTIEGSPSLITFYINLVHNWTEGIGPDAYGINETSNWVRPDNFSDPWTTGVGPGAPGVLDLLPDLKPFTLGTFSPHANGFTGRVSIEFDDDYTSLNAQIASDGVLSFGGNVTPEADTSYRIDSIEGTNPWELYVEYAATKTAPTCTQSNTNITVNEDSGSWTLDENMSVALNISCTDADGDALTYTEISETGSGGLFTNPNNDDLIFTTSANASGTRVVTYNVSDGITGDAFVSAQVTVTAIDDANWIHLEIGNATVNNILEDVGEQSLGSGGSDFNLSGYMGDVEDHQSPVNISLVINETDISCSVKTNLTLFCTSVNNFTGDYIMTANFTDSGNHQVEESFEGFITAVDDVPWWDEIGNLTIDITEDGGEQSVYDDDVSDYFNSSYYWWDVEDLNEPDNISINVLSSDVVCNMASNFSLFCEPVTGNFTGSVVTILNGTDSGNNQVHCSFELVVTAVDDVPWWDLIGNGTYSFSEDSNEPVLDGSSNDLNVSYFYQDVESPQTPSNITISSINESDVDCYMLTDDNFTMFCSGTNNFTGVVSVCIIGYGTNYASTCFEINVDAVNDEPWWYLIDDIEKDEGFGDFTIDLSANISDVEDGDDILEISFNSNDSNIEIISLDNSTDIMTIHWAGANISSNESINISLILVDSGGLTAFESFDLIILDVDQEPWWDNVGNSTATSINEDSGSQDVLNNYSIYFRDFEDDQTPQNPSVSTNETDVSCSESDNVISCNPINNFTGDFIIILSADDSASHTITHSFEGFVSAINDNPLFDFIDDIVRDEDFVNFTIDLSANISDVEDSDATLEISYDLNNSDWIVTIDNGTNIVTIGYFTVNATGAVNVSLTLIDSGGLIAFESFVLGVNEINDNPWWDEIQNGTIKISNYIETNVLTNAIIYFRDVEDDQNPSTKEVVTNESGIDCLYLGNGLLCESNEGLLGSFIIMISMADSGGVNITYSFEVNLTEFAMDCVYESEPILSLLDDKINVYCYTRTNDSGDYLLYLKHGNNTLAVYPQREEIKEYGIHESFKAKGGLVSLYYKKDYLLPENSFDVVIKSANKTKTFVINPQYEEMKEIPELHQRLSYNWGSVFVLLALLFVSVLFVLFMWRRAKS